MSLEQEMEYEVRKLLLFRRLHEGLDLARVLTENLKLHFMLELPVSEALKQADHFLREQRDKVDELNDEFFSTKR